MNNYNNSGTLSSEEFELGSNIINWSIFDGNSNKETCSFEIFVGIDPRVCGLDIVDNS